MGDDNLPQLPYFACAKTFPLSQHRVDRRCQFINCATLRLIGSNPNTAKEGDDKCTTTCRNQFSIRDSWSAP